MPVDPEKPGSFLIGSGVHDVTGPAAKVGMMGYAQFGQTTAGIHMRLRSRAFVIASPSNGKRVVFVSADLHSISQAVKLGVVKMLKRKYGVRLYSRDNVLISATHTHSGPGGFSRYRLYLFPYLKFNKQNYKVIVDGIFRSIVKAHEGLKPGTIRVASAELLGASINRSPIPYRRNEDRDIRPGYDTNKLMTVLRLDNATGHAVGMISWFAVHATSMGNSNRLISGDNKGYASYLFEKAMGTRYDSSPTFVAAFAQSDEGDASPNICSTDIPGRSEGAPPGVECRGRTRGEGADDFESTRLSGERQYKKAMELYEGAKESLTGIVDYRHTYVRMDSVELPDTGGHERKTCKAAIGYALAAGTPDGRGPCTEARKGMTCNQLPEHARKRCKNRKTWNCQGVKPDVRVKRILWFRLTPHVLPAQILRIGDLALVAVPFELTTVAGQRLRQTVQDELADGVRHVVIAGLANAYASYVTTPEEYDLQFYEGASTLFGRWTLDALREKFASLATALRTGVPVEPGPEPRDLTAVESDQGSVEVMKDEKPSSVSFGDVFEDAHSSYQPGHTVRVTFWGGNPNNDPRTQRTFLKVEKKTGASWETVANDWDWETKYEWQRGGPFRFSRHYSFVTAEWVIPSNAQPGAYRIRHFGDRRSGDRKVKYVGTSREFTVVAT